MFPCIVTFQFLYDIIPLNGDGAVVKKPPVSAGDARGSGSVPGLGRCPPVFLPEISMDRGAWWVHSPQGHKELDATEQLSKHTHKFA